MIGSDFPLNLSRFAAWTEATSISSLNFLFTKFTETSLNPPPDMTMAKGNFFHLLWVKRGSLSSRPLGMQKSSARETQKTVWRGPDSLDGQESSSISFTSRVSQQGASFLLYCSSFPALIRVSITSFKWTQSLFTWP